MSSGGRVCATVITAAAFFLCCLWVVTGRARAGDSDDARTMLFSGRDLWRNGAFAYGGFVFAPGGLEQDGLLLKVLLKDKEPPPGGVPLTTVPLYQRRHMECHRRESSPTRCSHDPASSRQ